MSQNDPLQLARLTTSNVKIFSKCGHWCSFTRVSVLSLASAALLTRILPVVLLKRVLLKRVLRKGVPLKSVLLKGVLLIASLAMGAAQVYADVLLTGTVQNEKKETVQFTLNGENRDDVIGGSLQLGDLQFTITNVSVHRLVGGTSTESGSVRYAVFSSSYSKQTSTGQPWVASERYLQCNAAYNSFLAIYTVDEDKALKLPEPPFFELTESTDNSEQSIVYCFVSAPVKN